MPVTIRKMTIEEFESFCQWSAAEQGKELMELHGWSEEKAMQTAKEELASMLPRGLYTEHNNLMTIEESTSKEFAGYIWTLYEITQGIKQSFLCDFVILESKRRRGYGAAALTLIESEAKNAGCQESVLFVADHNDAAFRLYDKCGYQFLRKLDQGKYMIKRLV